MAEPRKIKALSARGAQACEQAKEPRCRCRCGGTLHGVKRGNVCDLSVGDPHYPGRSCATCVGTGQCYRCGGRGKVAREAWEHNPEPRICLQCTGTGKCWRCQGTGGVLRKGAREAAERERQAAP